MVLIGYRKEDLHEQSYGGLLFLDLMTKVTFGLVLIPMVYLIGFL